MFKNNTHQVNIIIAKTLAWTSLSMVVLVLTSYLGFFSFSNTLKITFLGAGLIVLIVPIILIKLKVSDEILKYLLLIIVSLDIGVLGTTNAIGIYLTFALAPIASCLYFDKKLTSVIGAFSYVVMAVSVYINSAGKMEVTYYNWSHLVTFRNYMIGFTLEYAVVMLFLYQISKRAQRFLKSQQDSLSILESENEKQKKISDVYKNTIAMNRHSVLEDLGNDMNSFSQEDFARLSSGHQFIAQMQEILKYSNNFYEALEQVWIATGEYFNLERIIFVIANFDDEMNRLAYQWCKNDKDALLDFCEEMSREEAAIIKEAYKVNGYIEIDGVNDIAYYGDNINKVRLYKYMKAKRLGTQVWIPTIMEGEYNGSVCFDKRGSEKMSNIDKFLLAEIVGTIELHIIRINANNANQAKSAFLSSMSHEIRTPMNAILGMTTVSLRREMSDEIRRNLNIIKSSSEGMLAIINDILDFSKIESGRIDIINENYKILSMLNDVSTIVNARNNEKGLELNFNIAEDLPTELHGDIVRIKQVMINLATNAIKYTDQGSVTVNVSVEKTDVDNVLLRYSVKDTGQGIKEEDLDKLFKSFSQVNQEQNHHKEGTGLGLAISKQLVELMNGHIKVESKYGVGSTFSFEIPQQVVDATPAGRLEDYHYDNTTDEEVEAFKALGKEILIVDDNAINLMVAEALFEPFEMNITTADSGEAALELLESKKFDLIFMDHYMPGRDGIDTTREIRKLSGNPNQNVPIVALTADAVQGEREKMLSAGMNDFLSKPIDLKKACAVLKRFLEKE